MTRPKKCLYKNVDMNKTIAFHTTPSTAWLVILSEAKDLKVGTQGYQFSKHQKLNTKHGSSDSSRIFPNHSVSFFEIPLTSFNFF
jgi:hypothetical protein